MSNPLALSHPSYGRVLIMPGHFVAAGAGVNPTVKGGAIASVQQLDAGAVPFWRARFNRVWRSRLHSIVVTPVAIAIADDLTVSTGAFTADGPGLGPWPFTDSEVDIVLRNAGAATVAAGYRLNIAIFVKQ